MEIDCNASFNDDLDKLFWPWHLALKNTLDRLGNKPKSSVLNSEIDCNASFTDNLDILFWP